MKERNQNPIQEKPIQRLLRHRQTRAYLKEDGWTEKPEEAKSFADVLEVAEACAQRGLSDVELILRLDGGGCEVFSVPMR